MNEYNNPSPDNEYILAGVSYFPLINLVLLFTSGRSKYFVKYHAGHATIIYTLNLLLLAFYISIYYFIRPLFTDTFNIDMIWGLAFSLHLISNFIYMIYCSVKAYQGNYLIIPIVTKIFYFLFNR